MGIPSVSYRTLANKKRETPSATRKAATMMRVSHVLLLFNAARALRPPPRTHTRCRPAAAAPFSAEVPDLAPSLQEALKQRNIQTPTPIQKVALEPLRAGASAVLAAETGSGKTTTTTKMKTEDDVDGGEGWGRRGRRRRF